MPHPSSRSDRCIRRRGPVSQRLCPGATEEDDTCGPLRRATDWDRCRSHGSWAARNVRAIPEVTGTAAQLKDSATAVCINSELAPGERYRESARYGGERIQAAEVAPVSRR